MAISEKYSFKDHTRGLLVLSTRGAVKLFDIRASVLKAIRDAIRDKDYSVVVPMLITGFANNGYPLSGTVHVKRKTSDIYIVKDDNRTYLLWLNNNRLNVFTRVGEYFNAGIIPQDIKDEFAEIGITIPGITTVTPVKVDRLWVLAAGNRRMFCHYDKDMIDRVIDARYNFYRASFINETDLVPGTEIVGANFSQQSVFGEAGDPRKEIFPPTMTGVIFKRCNLDNVKVPAGNTVTDDAGIQSTNKPIREQNDRELWILDDVSFDPVEPLNLAEFQRYGLSVDPADIPATPLDEPITKTAAGGEE